MSKITIELLDEVNCKIHNLEPHIRRKLNSKFSYMLPYAFHIPSFKLGRFDGKIKFFHLNGKTYNNLLPDILDFLSDMNLNFNLKDNREYYNINFNKIDENLFSHINWPENHKNKNKPIILREYQVKIINNFLENKTGVQEIATGAGKTIIIAALSFIIENSLKNKKRTLVIVPSKSLVTQTEEDYINVGLDVGVYYGERKEIGHTHTICTWQSLESIRKQNKNDSSKMSIEEFTKNVSCVICDEVHSCKINVLQNILTTSLNNIYFRFGLTGTIPKDDYAKTSIKVSIGETTGSLAAAELQEDGVLANCNIHIRQLIDFVNCKKYTEELKLLTVTNNRRLDYLAEMIKEISETGSTLVLVDRIKCGEELVSRIPGSALVTGSMKNTDRKKHYDEFATVENKTLIAIYKVASVGINIPSLENLVLIEPGKSFVRVIQSIGRSLRKSTNKDTADVYDICSTAKFSKRHLRERKKYYSDAQYPP